MQLPTLPTTKRLSYADNKRLTVYVAISPGVRCLLLLALAGALRRFEEKKRMRCCLYEEYTIFSTWCEQTIVGVTVFHAIIRTYIPT